MEDHQRHRLKNFFRGNLLWDAPLRDFVSFRVGGPAEVIAFPEDQEDLARLSLFLREEKISFYVLGEGTNLLVRNGGFKGVVIKLSSGFAKVGLERMEEGKVYVSAQAGERLSRILGFALQNSLTGLEFSSGIPGSVGGALVMNAGAYGGEVKDVIFSVSVLTPDSSLRQLGREDLRFSYRKLNLPPESIIVEAMFEFRPGNKQEITALIQENLNKRKNSQPLDLPSAGSVFRNPPGLYAARLIEELGLKGYQIGGAAVSERHGNFIVNRGAATAGDILELIAFIQKKVGQEKSIMLETEIRILGED